MDINMSLNLEGYPNRDSMKYKDLYSLTDCETVLRGTLRFGGFSLIVNVLKEIGLFGAEKVEEKSTWKTYFAGMVGKVDLEAVRGFKQRYEAVIKGE